MNLVIYHKSDFDGLCAGEICRRFLKDTELLGYEYGDRVPGISGFEAVYLVDISIKELLEMPDAGHRIVWIDHHQTAIAQWDRPNIPGRRLDGVAACRLCWQWFNGGERASREDYVERRVKEPKLVRLLGEYDIWDKRDPDADFLQYGLRAERMDWQDWQDALKQDDPLWLSARLQAGKIIARYKANTNATLIEGRGWTGLWLDQIFLVLNGHGNSHVFEAGIRPKHSGLLLWSHDGRKVTVSLYGVPHRPDNDLSVIARMMGGGGHRQACGFSLSLGSWVEILRDNLRPHP
jgi:oligoribonuclease NrnB/cAMP/cGMP phosphodiesterase (DHH superfamily)